MGFEPIFCQTTNIHTVNNEECFSSQGYYIAKKPMFYSPLKALTPDEIHMIDTLDAEERRSIEESVDPPAIGIIRDLKEPVRFSLVNLRIPEQGEVSCAGGRLQRINDDTLIYTTSIKSEKADEIRIFISEGNFPLEVKFNLFGKAGSALNQHELRGRVPEDGFYSTTTFGDQVIIQVIIPFKILTTNLDFTITKVIHVDNRYIPQESRSDCYQDANCSYANSYPYIDYLRKAAARLRFPVGQLYYYCSGDLLNDSRSKDYQPFLLTANHCFSSQSSANGLEARFDYWSTSCNSGVSNPDYVIVSGANIIQTNSQSDFTLVLLKEFPNGSRSFLGWTTTMVNDGEMLHSVHHPAGTFQKYSGHQNTYNPQFYCSDIPLETHHYTFTLGGQASGGSSGGAIVNSSGRVVGQLHGTCYVPPLDECNYNGFNNYWGRFDVSYSNNNLQYWLYGGGANVLMSTTPASSVDFGMVEIGSLIGYNLMINNDGGVPDNLNLKAGPATITGTDADQFAISEPNSIYVSPSTSGFFTIYFNPTSGGTKTATLEIPHNADNISSPETIILTGCAPPAKPGIISGKTDPCYGVQNTYHISSVPGATSYNWNYSGTGTLNWNKTNCILTPTGSGILRVSAKNSCGSGSSRTLSLTVSHIPGPSGPISGSSTVCQEQENVNYSVSKIINATSYIWELPIGASGSSISNNISVDYSNSAESGVIRVKGRNSCGNGTGTLLQIRVNSKPSTPVITQSGNVLTSNAISGNQWYENGLLIPGATDQTYNPDHKGSYYVVVTINGCSSNISNIIQLTDVDELSEENGILIYPNPLINTLTIEIPESMKKPHLEIINSIGQVFLSSFIENKSLIDLSDLSSGAYIIKLTSENSVLIKKFIKK